jgi:hypothetical protein
MVEKVRQRFGEKESALPREFVLIGSSSVRRQARMRGEASTPAPLDKAAAQLKQLIGKRDIADEDFIRAARSLRQAMKAELHSDPPMADVCLVMADALTFSAPDKLDTGAFRVLAAALSVLVKPQADAADARQLFSGLVQNGWQLTPAFSEDEFLNWAENTSA